MTTQGRSSTSTNINIETMDSKTCDNPPTIDIKPKDVLHALAVLTQPITKGQIEQSEKGHVISFENILISSLTNLEKTLVEDKNLKPLRERLCLSKDEDVHWRYVSVSLELIQLLNNSLEEALKTFNSSVSDEKKSNQAPPDVLSIGQQKAVSAVLQFIVLLGLGPCLSPGVGVPVELRSGFGKHLKSCKRAIDIPEQILRLSLCVDVLLECFKQTSLSTLVLTCHLGDLVAALLQLCYGFSNCDAKKRNKSSNGANGDEMKDIDKRLRNIDLATASPGTVVTAMKTDPGATCPHLGRNFNETEAQDPSVASSSSETLSSLDWQKYEKCLKDLLQQIYPPLLVRTLVMLQGGPRQPQKKAPKIPTFPPAPAWLRKVCGRLLSEQVMKPRGVQHVLRGLLEGTEGSGGSSTSDRSGTSGDWRKCNAVAKIIANCPMQACSVEEYYQQISPQVLDLLHIKDPAVARQFLRVASSIVSAMVKQHPELARKYVIGPMIKPLFDCLCTNVDVNDSDPSKIWLSEKSLSSCIESIHKVFVAGSEPHASLLMCLMPVVTIIFKLLCFCKEGVSHLRSVSKEIVKTFLKFIENKDALDILKLLAFDSDKTDPDLTCPKLHPGLKFAPGANGGVAVMTCAGLDTDADEEEQHVRVSGLVNLLKDLQKDGVTGEFFLFCLEELTSVLSQGDVTATAAPCSRRAGEELLHIEQRKAESKRKHDRKLMIMMLLIQMCETLDHTYLTTAQQVIKFAKTTLLRAIYILEHTDDVSTGVFESETITLAIGLLTATMSGAVEIKPDDRENMKELLPLLDKLASNHPHEEVQEMASDIRIAIATYGAVWTDALSSAAKKYSTQTESEQVKTGKKSSKLMEEESSRRIGKVDDSGVKKQQKKLIEEMTSNDSGITDVSKVDKSRKYLKPEKSEERTGADLGNDNGSKDTTVRNEESAEGSLLGQCLNELCDPLIPVRGHALIALARLINEKDGATLQKKDLLFGIFKENIAHDDSYIYLAAVNGLAGLTELYPVETVPVLVEEFIGVVDSTRRSRSVEVRMKLAEVLMKVSRSLGDLIPKYREVLINAFLAGCKDSDHLIRASSLSNLGQVCQLLRFSLGNIIQEVFHCTSALLKSDPDVEVRRAAVMVITMILRGVSQDAIQILQPILKDVYRLLKRRGTTDQDDVVRLHSQLALEELDGIMKSYLFPKQTLVKTLYVADKPPLS